MRITQIIIGVQFDFDQQLQDPSRVVSRVANLCPAKSLSKKHPLGGLNSGVRLPWWNAWLRPCRSRQQSPNLPQTFAAIQKIHEDPLYWSPTNTPILTMWGQPADLSTHATVHAFVPRISECIGEMRSHFQLIHFSSLESSSCQFRTASQGGTTRYDQG